MNLLKILKIKTIVIKNFMNKYVRNMNKLKN